MITYANIYSNPGTKVKFTAQGGYESQKEEAAKIMKLGKHYTVLRSHVSDSNSRFELEEFPGQLFNTALFSVANLLKLYIAVLDEVPDYMTPTLVAHSILGAHLKFQANPIYEDWIENSFRKVTIRVNKKEFQKIADMSDVYLGHENTTLGGAKSCAIPLPVSKETRPKVLQFAKMWKPDNSALEKELNVWKEYCDDDRAEFDGEDIVWKY